MKGKTKLKIKMSSIDLEVQKEDNFCLCSVLQTIFKKYDIKISQEEIANNLTPSENGFFAGDPLIKKFMRANGFDYQFYGHNQAPFNEPDMLLEDMGENNGLLGINSHIYLLKSFKDPKLEIIDPRDGGVIQTDIYQFLRKMENGEGLFGLIKYIH